jgi:hypothetical protein
MLRKPSLLPLETKVDMNVKTIKNYLLTRYWNMLLWGDPCHILSPCSLNYNNMDDEYFGSCVSSMVLKDRSHT